MVREVLMGQNKYKLRPGGGIYMKRLLILGAGDFQLPLIQEASKSTEVFLAAPVIEKKYYPFIKEACIADVRAQEEILAFAQQKKIDGVITDQTDIAVQTVAYVAEKLGLPGIGHETARLFTNKALMRKRLSELNIPQLPNREVFSLEEAKEYYKELGGEVVIKPVDTQGSRGVQTCRNLGELEEKYVESERWSTDRGVIIERLAKGREFFVEGITYSGEYKTLLCGDTHYFNIPDAFAAKERIVPTSADEELYQRVCSLDKEIITGFGLKQGLSHSEYIMDGDNIYLIETAARGGGVFISSDLIHLSTGLCTEKFLVQMALGQQKSMPKILPQQCVCGYMAMFIPQGRIVSLSGVETVRSLPYVHRNQLDKLVVGLENRSGNSDKTSRLALIVSAESRVQLTNRMDYIRNTLQAEVLTESGIQGLIWR